MQNTTLALLNLPAPYPPAYYPNLISTYSSKNGLFYYASSSRHITIIDVKKLKYNIVACAADIQFLVNDDLNNHLFAWVAGGSINATISQLVLVNSSNGKTSPSVFDTAVKVYPTATVVVGNRLVAALSNSDFVSIDTASFKYYYTKGPIDPIYTNITALSALI